MLSLDGPTVLYHGSSVVVENPDLSRCRPRKDFGRGFYLTSSRSQAESFARTVARRENRRDPEREQDHGMLSVYSFIPQDQLLIRSFSSADSEWLHCVSAHRGAKAFGALLDALAGYDVIVGKVANDQTNATLLAYMGGLYGSPGSREADEMCVGLLMPERLHDQACFRTERALGCLMFEGSDPVWL